MKIYGEGEWVTALNVLAIITGIEKEISRGYCTLINNFFEDFLW
jgi:hypothetical protein